MNLYHKFFFVVCMSSMIWFSCKKEKPIELLSPEVLLTINIPEEYLESNPGSWAVLSNLAGDIVQVEKMEKGKQLLFSNHKTINKDKFHLSLVNKEFYINDVIDFPNHEMLTVKTYAFIEPSILNITYPEETNITAGATYASITLTEDDGQISYGVISGTLTGLSNTKSYKKVGMQKDKSSIFLAVHIEGQDSLRTRLIENVANDATFNIRTSELSAVPLSVIEVPKNYNYHLHINGITGCTEKDLLFTIQGNYQGNDGQIPANYAPFKEAIFAHYFTKISLENGKERYLLEQFGEPVKDYLPTPISFSIANESITNFQLNSNKETAIYEVEWSASQQADGIWQSSTWTVYGDFKEDFNAPNLQEFLPEEAHWFDEKELVLQFTKEYNYSAYPSYLAWVDAQFNPEHHASICSRNNLQLGDIIETKILNQ